MIIVFLFIRSNASAPTLNHTSKQPSSSATNTDSSSQPTTEPSTFDYSQHSLTDANSIWVIVNKHNQLNPQNYVPTITLPNVTLKKGKDAESMHVSSLMAPHLEKMFAAAKQGSYNLMLSSGYRSYDYQVKVYGSEVKAYGKAKADTESARPGYSEHQTGLSSDIAPATGTCDLSQCFGDTPEGKWVAANAYKYGFVIRYPKGKDSVTGYKYEPWHVRYIGVEAATEMHDQGITTLEEFFSLEPAPHYN